MRGEKNSFISADSETLSIRYNFYRPQRSWGKVIFSQASVILLTGGGGASSRGWGDSSGGGGASSGGVLPAVGGGGDGVLPSFL